MCHQPDGLQVEQQCSGCRTVLEKEKLKQMLFARVNDDTIHTSSSENENERAFSSTDGSVGIPLTGMTWDAAQGLPAE